MHLEKHLGKLLGAVESPCGVTGLAGLQHQELESEYIGESKATELRGWRVSDVYIP
jgi:hypothetical protein